MDSQLQVRSGDNWGRLVARLLALSRGQVQARFGADLGCVLRDGFGMV